MIFLSTVTFIMISLTLVIAGCALKPGTYGLSTVSMPLSYGFHELFSLSMTVSPVFSIMPLLCTIYVVFAATIRQLTSMANSGLLPAYLKGGPQVNYISKGSIFAVPIGALICLAILSSDRQRWPENVFNLTSGCSYGFYYCFFASYFMFRKKYNGLPKPFTNPLGIAAAAYGIFVFAVAMLSLVILRDRIARATIFFATAAICATLYYLYFARNSQCFSDDEQKVLFVAYVINGTSPILYLPCFALVTLFVCI
jgi:hypothetical protein